jgi:hypothetical protein
MLGSRLAARGSPRRRHHPSALPFVTEYILLAAHEAFQFQAVSKQRRQSGRQGSRLMLCRIHMIAAIRSRLGLAI